MRNRIDLQTIIKYLAIPNFIMGSGNVAYNLYYKNRVEAAILRKKLEEETESKQKALEELGKQKDSN